MYDLAIIGAGWAGFNAALRAKELNLKVALIEKSLTGGACLNLGCIPTKALIHSVKVFNLVKKSSDFGIDNLNPDLNFLKVQERKNRVVEGLRFGMQSMLKGIDFFNAEARIISLCNKAPETPDASIAIITAGTSDIPVAEEAAVTAELLGNKVVRIYDAGVAGIHRLVDKLPVIRKCRVIVVIAGMEGALASVVGGLVDKPVIAGPTSVGYGASFGGISALLAMLTSCSSGVTVVNIDNGFGAGFSASMINKMK